MTNEFETVTNNAEALLEALIDQCREIIRDVVVPAAQAASDDMQRRLYINSAAELVKTGAAVGDTLARLRGGGSPEMRQRIVVERIEKSARLLDIPKAVRAAASRSPEIAAFGAQIDPRDRFDRPTDRPVVPHYPTADKQGEGGTPPREE